MDGRNRASRRRPPRRRFHSLHADVALVAALAAALVAALATAIPPAGGRTAAGTGGFSAAAAPVEAADGADPVFTPLAFAFGAEPDAARSALPDIPPLPVSPIERGPVWTPSPPLPTGVAGPDAAEASVLPVSSLLSDLSPAAPLFSEPRPVPPAPPPEPPPPVSVARFRSGPDAPPVAVVDAPGADQARLRELEAAAYAEGR